MSDLFLEKIAEKYGVTDFISDEGMACTDAYKKWQAAHRAMLAAFKIGDFDCAAQDCKEAREYASALKRGTLDEYYDIMLDQIIKRFKNL